MRLKRVRIFGFKTFAEKTEFELDGDIVAIVGPNGCGKSNIVDAILWGLGEPNARNLRAAQSQDVIFNGSAKRKPLGYAEVTLIFDNEDGALPIDTAEVAVTRRVTRAGDSHFSINRKACRLKDIYDLLADSGLGRAGYAIVGQREIDQALSASAEDRRAWIDEAAGVQRFRAKRTESIRRLDSAKDHLSRLDQILEDIEFQREPLKEEAELAQKYQSIKAALTELEVSLLSREIRHAAAELQETEARIERSASQGREDAENELVLQERLRQLGEEIAETERQLDAFRELRQSQISLVERAQASRQLAEQRLHSLAELESSLSSEQDQSAGVLAAAEEDLREAAKEEAALLAALEKLRAEAGGMAQALANLRAELDALDAQIAQARRLEAEKIKRQADLEQSQKRAKEIRIELKGIDQSLPDLEGGIAEAEANAAEQQIEIQALQAQINALEQQRLERKKAADQAEHAYRARLAEQSSLEGKRRGLEATLQTHEGLSQGALAVMALVRQGQLSDGYVPVAEAISTKPEFAQAIEVALGGAAHDLIVPDESYAKRAIEQLKAQRLGRATFQPLSMVRPSYVSQELRRLSQERGVVGIASELVDCAPEHRPLAQSLLGRILIVETLDDSLRLGKQQGFSRIVTLEGEVVHASGAVTGGRTGRHTAGIVQRKAELEQVEANLARIEKDLAQQQASVELLAKQEAECQQQVQTLKATIATFEPGLREAEKWLANLRGERQSTLREKERLERELGQLSGDATVEDVPLLDLDELTHRRDEKLAERARLAGEGETGGQRLTDTEDQLQKVVERRQNADKRRQSALDTRLSREKRLENFEAEKQTAQDRIAMSEQEASAAQAKAEEFAAKIGSLQKAKEVLLQDSLRVGEEARAAAKAVQSMSDLIHRLEIERARLDSRRAAAAQRLLEEYGLNEEEAREVPDSELPDDAPAVVGRLRRDLKALGNVNLGAIEAYERLTTRFIELDAQRQDVRAGMEEIQHAIRELDRMTRDRFLNTFEQVREEFKIAFNELFGGGEADLSLTETEQVLTAGVNVDVTIPGKKRQRLELLSGGERSLSAVAFLFALLRVKPSPLVVLDEVDAPLDGRNVERYVDILRSFKGKTQFLVITHNMITIEAAPVWFGVTMQEPGCSSVVPCRIPSEAEKLIETAALV